MRILFVSDTYYPHLNGVYYFVCRIAPLLQAQGHSVAVVAPSETTRFTRKVIDDIPVFGVPSLPVVLYPKIRTPLRFGLRRRVKALIHEFVPDIIHVQDHFLLSRTVIEISKQTGIATIGTNHFMPENLTSWIRSERWKKIMERLLWKRFSRVYDQLMLVTTPTETAAKLIRPLLQTEVMAVSSGIDLKMFGRSGDCELVKARYGIPDKPVLLFVGRLDPEKKLEQVLDAAAIGLRQMDFCLVIVGKGVRKRALEERAAALGITGNVIFTGFVPEADLPMIYDLSSCFVIASIAELLSLATLQAMSCGLPVVAARAGALEELVHHGENGFLFEPGDIGAMAEATLEIMRNNSLRQQMGVASRAYSRQHDIHECVKAFENIYEYLVHEGFWEVVDESGRWVLASAKEN